MLGLFNVRFVFQGADMVEGFVYLEVVALSFCTQSGPNIVPELRYSQAGAIVQSWHLIHPVLYKLLNIRSVIRTDRHAVKASVPNFA